MMLLGLSPAMEASHQAVPPLVEVKAYFLQVPVGFHQKLVRDISGTEPNGPAFLTATQLRLVMAAFAADRRVSIVQAPRSSAFSGEWGYVEVGGLMPRPLRDDGTASEPLFMGVKFHHSAELLADNQFAVQMKFKLVEPLPFADGDVEPLPATRTLTVNTKSMVPVGKTLLVAGGITETEVRTEYVPPVLNMVPYLARMFTTVTYEKQERQLLVLLTPTMVTDEPSDPKLAADWPLVCPFYTAAQKIIESEPGCTRQGGDGSRPHAACCEVACPSVVHARPPHNYGEFFEMPCAEVVKFQTTGAMSMLDVLELNRYCSDEVIVNQIRTTGATFALGTQDLIRLSKEHVSDTVILAMQNTRPSMPEMKSMVEVVGFNVGPAPHDPWIAQALARAMTATACYAGESVIELVCSRHESGCVMTIAQPQSLPPAFQSTDRYWFEKQLAPTPFERIQGWQVPSGVSENPGGFGGYR